MKTSFILMTGAIACAALSSFAQNTTYGTGAGASLTTGAGNTFIGNQAGHQTNTGDDNTATGDSALYSNTSGLYNSAFGYHVLKSNTTGYSNSGFGFNALRDNTGIDNCGFGHYALVSNTSGSYNTAYGSYASVYNLTGNYNTALGYLALNKNTASYNAGISFEALMNNTSGNQNTGGGFQALYSNTTGSSNTAFGYTAGFTNTTGSSNTFIGCTADANANNYSNATALGYGTVVNASNKVRLGNTSVTVVEGQVAYTTSDKRFKFNIHDDVKGLEFIQKLRPVSYQFDTRKFDEFLTKNMPDSIRQKHMGGIDYKPSTDIVHTGFLAQDVEQAAKDCHFTTDIVHAPVNDNDNYSVSYQAIVVPLVKAVQEQQSMIDSLKHQVNQLSQVIKALSGGTATPAGAPSLGSNAQAVQLSNADVVVLNQNVPNPFSEQTVINYSVPQTCSSAQILFYNQSGTLLKTIDIRTKGKGQLTVFASDLNTGLYSYSLVVDGKIIDSKKMIKE